MSVYKPKGYDIHLIKLPIAARQQRFPGVTDKTASRGLERQLKRLIAL
jgi:hypothetical protein